MVHTYGRAVRLALLACAVGGVAGAGTARAVTFNLTADAGMDPAAIAGFQSAANYWSSVLSDNITVNLNIGYSVLSGSTLANANSSLVVYSYGDIRNALTGSRTSAADFTSVASLPGGSNLSFRTNDLPTGTSYIDNNNTGNNGYLGISTANAKALGLATSASSDATIRFNSAYSWDLDRGDGISGGSYDFVGAAIHEIGHALGFQSASALVDAFAKPNGLGYVADPPNGNPTSLDNYAILSVLDLFRYGGVGALDVGYGGTPYFSIDGGVTSLALFSTGDKNGDGGQGGHWKDGLGLGIMDPTAAPGEFMVATPLDLLGLDVIGFETVPEPATAGMLALAALPLLRRRRA